MMAGSTQSLYQELSETFKSEDVYTLLDPSLHSYISLLSKKKSAPMEYLAAAIIPGTTVMMGNCRISAHDVSQVYWTLSKM